MRRSMLRSATLLAAALLAGCSVMVDPDQIAPDAPAALGTDTTPPTVMATSPADLATGVVLAPSISVTFSEPVDRASAQAAFSIVSPPGHATGTFSWTTDGRTMTFDPAVQLSPGDSVSCRVATAVKDLAGNSMAAEAVFAFTALRLGTVTLYSDAAIDGVVWSTGMVFTANPSLFVGDNIDNAYGRAFVSFDLGQVPASATAISAATLSLYQESGTYGGAPYDTLAPLQVERVDYGVALDQADLALPALDAATYTLCISPATGWTAAEVPASVDAAWKDRAALGGRVQFRLRFATNTNSDGLGDTAELAAGETATAPNRPSLTVSYLYP